MALDLPPRPRVLEIGCGTGFLGAGLVDRLDQGRYWMTDIAPGMVDRARRRFGDRGNVDFAVMDGAALTIEGPFDLICSSLAMQWIADLPDTITRLRARLAPGGFLIFTTLAAGSFAEWRAAYEEDLPGTPDYPSAAELERMGLRVNVETIAQDHPSARHFLHALKAIGAATPQAGYRPLPLPALRRVMARFEAGGAKARYEVATCIAGAAQGNR
jgi:malonyl-CoA O-methyltransferase